MHTDPSIDLLELSAVLLDAGVRLDSSLATFDGPAWSATVLQDGAALVARVVDDDPLVRARLRRLVAVRHAHLATVRAGLGLGGGRLVVLEDLVAGPTLETVSRARGPFTVAEAVTLVVPLAEALDAVHAAGAIHGHVASRSIVVDLLGRPVLVGVTAGAAPVGWHAAGAGDRALPAQARATAAADVAALAALVLDRLGPSQLWEGDPASSALRAALAAACGPDPGTRIGARELADACHRAEVSAPIALPDAGALAAAELTVGRLVVDDPGTVGSGRAVPRRAWVARPDTGERQTAAPSSAVGGARAVSEPDTGTVGLLPPRCHDGARPPARNGGRGGPPARTAGLGGPPGRSGGRGGSSARRRHRARGRPGLLRTLAGVGAVGVCLGIAVTLGSAGGALPGGRAGAVEAAAEHAAVPSSSPNPTEPTATTWTPATATSTGRRSGAPAGPGDPTPADATPADPAQAARVLTARRAAALVGGEPSALLAVEVEGSPAHRADLALLAGLAADGNRLVGVQLEIGDVRVLDSSDTRSEVAVTSRVSPHQRIGQDGTVTTVGAATGPPVVLVLARTPDGWRVAAVEPG